MPIIWQVNTSIQYDLIISSFLCPTSPGVRHRNFISSSYFFPYNSLNPVSPAHMCTGMGPSTGRNCRGHTSLIKMDSSSHSSLQFPIALSYGWCLLSLSSIHARMLTGLTLYRQTHLLRVCGTIPEYTVFQQSSLIWAITVFLPSPP